MVALPSAINVDPLQPSSKKSKSHLVDYTNSLHGMENMTEMDTTEEPNRGSWGSHTFADMCREEVPVPQLYFEELCEIDQSDGDSRSTKSPVVSISPQKYHNLFQPWRGALVLKLLGKSISYRVLEQRTWNLWNLELGYELIDLEQGLYLARFFSQEDYFKVFEGCSWIIMGQYLTISKWKPNF